MAREITLKPNIQISLDGTSIWDRAGTNPETVNVSSITLREEIYDDDSWWDMVIEHDGPWEIYTDKGFVKGISDLVGPGWDVDFSEQGLQEDGRAHFDVHSTPDEITHEVKESLEMEGN